MQISIEIAEKFYEQGRLNEAQEVCERIVASDPNDLFALSLLGTILARLKKQEQALSVLETYVSKVPSDAHAFFNMGLIFNNLGRPEDAIEAFGKAVGIYPNFSEAHLELAQAYLELDMSDVAVHALRDSSEMMEEEAAKLNLRLAELLFDFGQTQDALTQYGKSRPDARPSLENCKVFNISDLREYCKGTNTEFSISESLPVHKFGSNSPLPGISLFIAELNEGGVLGDSCLPVTKSGAIFIDQLIHRSDVLIQNRVYQDTMSVFMANDRQIVVPGDEEVTYGGPHLLVGNFGSIHNFGHWLLNYFSRMILVRERKDLTSIPVVVADDLSGTRLECLTRLGYGEDQIVRVPAGQIAWFENLWVPSLPYFVSPKADALVWTPEVIHFLRSALGASSKRRDDKPPRRLFITRRHTKWRRLNNEDEVFAAVQPLGFERIDPGELSLDEQINLASEAEIIMGPMGAGMNLHYFAPKETKVIEMKLKLPDNDMEINRPIAAEIG
jgi:predicted negative regulator of RcsB-dependent stress response